MNHDVEKENNSRNYKDTVFIMWAILEFIIFIMLIMTIYVVVNVSNKILISLFFLLLFLAGFIVIGNIIIKYNNYIQIKKFFVTLFAALSLFIIIFLELFNIVPFLHLVWDIGGIIWILLFTAVFSIIASLLVALAAVLIGKLINWLSGMNVKVRIIICVFLILSVFIIWTAKYISETVDVFKNTKEIIPSPDKKEKLYINFDEGPMSFSSGNWILRLYNKYNLREGTCVFGAIEFDVKKWDNNSLTLRFNDISAGDAQYCLDWIKGNTRLGRYKILYDFTLNMPKCDKINFEIQNQQLNFNFSPVNWTLGTDNIPAENFIASPGIKKNESIKHYSLINKNISSEINVVNIYNIPLNLLDADRNELLKNNDSLRKLLLRIYLLIHVNWSNDNCKALNSQVKGMFKNTKNCRVNIDENKLGGEFNICDDYFNYDFFFKFFNDSILVMNFDYQKNNNNEINEITDIWNNGMKDIIQQENPASGPGRKI